MSEPLSGVNRRWLPPSPHQEEIAAWISKGRAHIEERGHDKSPLLVFEDGGKMELDLVRISPDGREDSHGLKQLVSVERNEREATRFTDVCGTVDRLKELIEESGSPDEVLLKRMDQLTANALYMINRMQRRGRDYEKFAGRVCSLTDTIDGLKLPETKAAKEAGQELKKILESSTPEDVPENTEKLKALAEEIRRVAGKTEKVLYAYRDFAIELGKLYSDIRGARKWKAEKE